MAELPYYRFMVFTAAVVDERVLKNVELRNHWYLTKFQSDLKDASTFKKLVLKNGELYPPVQLAVFIRIILSHRLGFPIAFRSNSFRINTLR